MIQLSIVVPCYNEEEVLPETIRRLTELLDDLIMRSKISNSSVVIFVDDGSRDRTWEIVHEASKRHALVAGAYPADHRDPVDRMLAAQSSLEGLPLVTRDPVFTSFGNPCLW